MENEVKSSKAGKWILLAALVFAVYVVVNSKPVIQDPASQVTASPTELSQSYIEREDAADKAAIDEVLRNPAWTPKTQHEEDLLKIRMNEEIAFILKKRQERDAVELSKQKHLDKLAKDDADYQERYAKEVATAAASPSVQTELPEIAAVDEVALPPLTEEAIKK